jgi:hypothetical protein
MFALSDDTLLVDERDNRTVIKNIVEINVSSATNVLNADTFGGNTLEQMTVKQLQDAGIVFPSRNIILNLLNFGYPFAKVEGLTLVGKRLSVVNDNDFDIGGTDPTQLWTFELAEGSF